MKLGYHTYSIQQDSNEQHFLMDLRPLIKAFCTLDNPKFKNKFTYNDEHLYLLPIGLDLYLFLTTRSHEIIKRIKTTDLSLNEISNLLEKDESLGFASYVYFKKNYFGFASTMLAPKSKAFVEFINNIFDEIGINDYWFIANPIMHESSKNDVLNMPFIGRSVITVNSDNTTFQHLRNMVNGTTQEFSDIDSFDIVIKPRNKKNIKGAVSRFIKKVPDKGLDKMFLRAKEDIHGSLIDLYITGKGGVHDVIKTKDERLLHDEIARKIKENKVLSEKVKAHESDDKYTKKVLKPVVTYNDVAAWDSFLSGV